MSQPLGALKTANDFSRVLASKPLGRSGAFWVHMIPGEIQTELGFILPKRHLKRAVWRNQVRRWSKAAFRKASLPPVKAVIRVAQPLKINNWARTDRQLIKQALLKSLESAFEGFQK